MELLCCNCGTSVVESAFDWGKFLISMGPVLVGILAIVFTNVQTNKNLNSKKVEEKRQEIYKKLNDFYGPLLQLRKKSNRLYQKFSESHKTTNNQFRTLTYLLDGNTFRGNDETLLKEIIDIGEQCEKLIQEKSGLIDDSHLRTEVLPKATTHFLILRLAYNGALKGDSAKYKDLTFPSDLDNLLEKRKSELEAELRELNKPMNIFSFKS